MPPRRLRGVYGGPLGKSAGGAVQLPKALLDKAGEVLLESIRQEIRADVTKARAMARGRGKPVPLPDSPRFIESFKYRIKGKSTVEFYSDWPTAEAHTKTPDERGLEGRGSDGRPIPPRQGFPMTWLVQPAVKKVPIVTTDGLVLIRTAPMTTGDAWIHPGFIKYTFLERGIRKGKVQFIERYAQEIVDLSIQQGLLF